MCIYKTFSDVLIRPKYSEISSRKNVDISSDFGVFKLKIPIISSNMKTITGPNMAITMAENGCLGILHRFNTIEQNVSDFIEVKNKNITNVGVSIGVQEEDKERFDKLYESGAKIFVIDVAHGHCKLVKDMICWIKKQKLKDIYIIAGNIVTADAYYDLSLWGVDCCKCGVGSGSVCFTRRNVGVGIPQLGALEEIYNFSVDQKINTKIISDGGIKYIGDIAKALKYSHAVMVGSFISGTTETPGSVFRNKNGQYYKVYMGSASGENKLSNNKSLEYIEGVSMEVPFRGHVKYILKEIKDGVQSAFSYVGANNINEFKNKCEFVYISEGSKKESNI